MDRLTYELLQMTRRNRDGSHATQADRRKHLRLIAAQLQKMGYRNLRARSLKTRHVTRLLEKWQTEISPQTKSPVSIGTIKNRMATLRWWANKIQKQNIIPRTNKALGIDNRAIVCEGNRAFSLESHTIDEIPGYLQLSLRLQEEFGLRREEAAKIVPSRAIEPNYLSIESSWAKGGRARKIPVTTNGQKELLCALDNWYEGASLIPSHLSYRRYLAHRGSVLYKFGITKTHGLRHQYAQRRYVLLTGGLLPPKLGGKQYRELNTRDRNLDQRARLQVAQELGHARIEITRVYLG